MNINQYIQQAQYKKGFIAPLLLALIALLLIGGGAYVYVQNKQSNQPVTATSAAQTSNPQTTDWKTYTNTQYGFQLEYIDGTKLPDHMHGPNDNAIRFQPIGAKENTPGSFVINVMSAGDSTCSSQTKAGQSTPFTHVTINGVDFIKYDIFVDINNTHWTEYCTAKNGSEYLIGFVPPANTDVTADPVLSRVISSFQFK